MNILPKKSWHVRTRKNIERVQRDEAEAEKLQRDKQDRSLRAEQEARIRELRARAGLPEQASSQGDKHFNLFEGNQEQQQTTNPEHEEEERQRVAAKQQRAGIWNKLVRSNDVNRPWYCVATSTSKESTSLEERPQCSSKLVTSIYDPMAAIKQAEEIVRSKRSRNRTQHDKHSVPRLVSIEDDLSGSSPEIIGEVVGVKVMDKKKKKHKKEKKHHKKHKEKKTKKSKHHRQDKR